MNGGIDEPSEPATGETNEWAPPGESSLIPIALEPAPPSPALPPLPSPWIAPPGVRPASGPTHSPLVVIVGVLTAVVLAGGLLAVVAGLGRNSRTKFTTVASSIGGGPQLPASSSWTRPPDPAVPAGFTLYQDPAGRFEIALPDSWFIVDLSQPGGVDAAIDAAKQAHPDRAATLTSLRATFQGSEVVVAVGPVKGALVNDLLVSEGPPLHGITSGTFVSSYSQQLRAGFEPTNGPMSDLNVVPTAINGQPALRTTFNYTQTLSSGATDHAYRFVALVEGNKNDFVVRLTTDAPDDFSGIFDQAASTLTSTT